jgi:energy-coupling factor transporter transmembrane protein EcfT
MKLSNLFWGTILLTIGLLLLINNFYNVELDFDTLWKIAPLFLVFIGISIFIKNKYGKYILIFISAVLLSLTIFAFFNSLTKLFFKGDFDFNSGEVVEVDSTFYSYQFDDNIKQAKLYFNGGAGRFSIKSSTSNLIDAKTFSAKNLHTMKVETTDSTARVEFGMKDSVIKIGEKYKNHIDFSLNRNPVWDLDFECGAAVMNYDLKDFKVKSVIVDMGAAELNLTLGEKFNETRVSINAGASRINLKIPSNSGCEITADAVLSSKDFEGFKKFGSNKFRTENFDNSENKIFIDLNCGVSSINIRRY